MANELSTVNVNNGFLSTLTLDTAEERDLFLKAMNGAQSLAKYTKKLVVTHVITKPGIRAISGDSCIDTYLVLKNGDVVFTQSTGIYQSILNFLLAYNNDLSAGVPVKVFEQTIPNGRTVKRLMPDE